MLNAQWKCLTTLSALVIGLGGCASSPEWPAREVRIEDMKLAHPWGVSFPLRNMDHMPCGRIDTRMWVDEQGRVQQVKLAKGSGDGRLDRASVDGALRARFHPYRVDGQAVPVTLVVEQRFGRNPDACAR